MPVDRLRRIVQEHRRSQCTMRSKSILLLFRPLGVIFTNRPACLRFASAGMAFLENHARGGGFIMNCSRSITALTLLVGLAGVGHVRADEPKPIPLDQLEKLHTLIKLQPGESRWMEIDWHPSVWEARQKAAAQGKPLFAAAARPRRVAERPAAWAVSPNCGPMPASS